jgi:sulfotransferase family protein
MLTAPRDARELVELRSSTLAASMERRHLFDDLECFCLFVGSGRSGHSLVGSLLDAHPEVIIAHQLNVLHLVHGEFNRWQIFHLLLANSEHYAEHERKETGYVYTVPNQWQGRFHDLRVIGDKSGAASENKLSRNPWLFERLRERVELPVKLIHSIRNPWDNISTVSKRVGMDLPAAVDRYFGRCDTVANLLERVPASDVLHVRHEELVADPTSALRALCSFVGVDVSGDYLGDAAGIVRAEAHKSRHKAPWTPELIADVKRRCERYPFLEGYSYDD